MRSVFKASFIAVAATIVMLPVGAQSAGLLGDGGLLGTGIGTPTGALGTGLLASNDGGSSGGGVLGTGEGRVHERPHRRKPLKERLDVFLRLRLRYADVLG